MTASIVASVLAADEETLRRRLEAASPFADLLEIRLDGYPSPDVESLVGGASRPVIATCRRARDGGRYEGSEDARIELLRRAAAAGAAWVDVEVDAADRLRSVEPTRRIVSLHDPEGMPEDLEGAFGSLRDAGADLAKLAVTPRRLRDVGHLLEAVAVAAEAGPVAGLTMGEIGRVGRLVSPRYGSSLVYGSTAPGAEAAPGQVAVRVMREVHRTSRIGRATRLHAVLGADVSGSPSPAVFNAAFEAAGIDRAYVPLSCDDPAEVLRELPGGMFDGFSVTMPHKEVVLPLLDRVEETARRIGAVNTIVREPDGRLRGENTDGPGILDALTAAGRPDVHGLAAVVLGAGGAARAAAIVLADAGASVTVTGRSPARVAAVAALAGGKAVSIDAISWAEVSVVVQATPLGTHPTRDPLPFDPGRLALGTVVLDVVAIPPITPLLAAVDDVGGVPVSGMEMFLAQAARQWTIWTGKSVPSAAMRAAAGDWVRGRRPVALLGLRGAGKSTVGIRLAEVLGRPFLDTDVLVEEETGRAVGEILASEGEERFRDLEEAAVRKALETPGAVVALGGGAVEREATRCLLRGTATSILLDAPDADLLARTSDAVARPPLTVEEPLAEIALLRSRRMPRYRTLALHTASTASPRLPAEVVDDVVRRLDADAPAP